MPFRRWWFYMLFACLGAGLSCMLGAAANLAEPQHVDAESLSFGMRVFVATILFTVAVTVAAGSFFFSVMFQLWNLKRKVKRFESALKEHGIDVHEDEPRAGFVPPWSGGE